MAVLLISIILFAVGSKVGRQNVFGFFMLDLEYVARFGFIAFFLIFLLSAFIGWLVYINFVFFLDTDAVKIRRGIFNKQEVAIPYRQIQDVDIERNFAYQILGLSELVILTAGHEEKDQGGESEGVLPALDKDLADSLRDELLRRANVEKIVEEK